MKMMKQHEHGVSKGNLICYIQWQMPPVRLLQLRRRRLLLLHLQRLL